LDPFRAKEARQEREATVKAVRDWDRDEVLLGQLTGEKGPAPGGIPTRRKSGVDRRKRPIWSFIYGCFHPRRRSHRREKDHGRLHIDWHDSGLLYLSLAIVLLSCTDALFTLNLLAVGGEELNGFMKVLIEEDVSRFLTVKIAATGIGVIILVAASRYRLLGSLIVKRILQLVCLGYVVLIGYELMLLGPLIKDTLGLTEGFLAELLTII